MLPNYENRQFIMKHNNTIQILNFLLYGTKDNTFI